MKFRQFIIDYYIPYYRNTTKDLNFQKENSRMKVMLTYDDFVSKEIETIRKIDIENLLLQIKQDRSITNASINRYRSRISAIFALAIDYELLTENPTFRVRKYREEPRDVFLTLDECKRLLEECKRSKNKELYSIVTLALNCGMRKNEILTLEANNIYHSTIKLHAERTKSGKSREIPMNNATHEVVNDINASGALFSSKYIRRSFNYAKERAGISKEVRFHDLRRTFATLLKYKNIDIHTISKLLGHSTIRMTEIYLGLDKEKYLDSTSVLMFN